MNIPNLLTIIRFLLIPILIKTFYSSSSYLLPLSIFIIAGATDILDGYIARKYNLITKWGKILDPMADKLLQVSVLFVLADKGIIPWWIFAIIILKEVFMMIGSFVVYKKKIIVQAKWYGKAATVLFYAAILLYMISVNKNLEIIALVLVIFAALYAAIRYYLDYSKVIKKS